MNCDNLFPTFERIDGTENVMTPKEVQQMIKKRNKKGRDHDNDDNVENGDIGKPTKRTNKKPRKISSRSTVQKTNYYNNITQKQWDRNELTSKDVILGRSSEENKVYVTTLETWWQRYGDASHSKKRYVCRDAVSEMHAKGIRFFTKMHDGSRHGYYLLEPEDSDKIERKVLRSLRSLVLLYTVRIPRPPMESKERIILPEASDPPTVTSEPPKQPPEIQRPKQTLEEQRPKQTPQVQPVEQTPKVQPVKQTLKVQPVKQTPNVHPVTQTSVTRSKRSDNLTKGPSSIRPTSSKKKVNKGVRGKIEVTSRRLASARKKFKLKNHGMVDSSYINSSTAKYIPILPTTARLQNVIQIAVPPPLVPAPPPPLPPVLRMNSSLASVNSSNEGPKYPLIPSAINWSISDIADSAPGNNTQGFVQLPIVANSPDTVLTMDAINHFSTCFGTTEHNEGYKQLMGQEVREFPPPTYMLPLRSNVSYDFSRIFDDHEETTMDESDPKLCPPVLTGGQSSMFSVINFKDWTHSKNENDTSAPIPGPSNINDCLTLLEDDLAATFSNPINVINNGKHEINFGAHGVKCIEHFDQNTIFDEGMATISPTPIRFNNNNVARTSYITPLNNRYNPSTGYINIPTLTDTKRKISDAFDETRNDTYHALCNKLEVSLEKLVCEENQHKSWEAHNEALWNHFIEAQPDLAKMLMSRARESVGQNNPTTTKPPSTTNSCRKDYKRSTSPVQEWFHDSTPLKSEHESVSVKWQQLFASDNEDDWEEV